MLAKKCLLVGIFTLLSLSLAISAQPLHPATGEPLVIDCLRGTPDAIDGDLSDWNLGAMTPAVLDAAEQLYSGQDSWTGPEDCSGKFYMMWDDMNIYMAVVVKDEKLSMNKTDGSIWNADCVEVFFATTDAEAEHSWTNPTIHYQYGFNANNQKWNWCNMHGPGQSEPDYLQIAATETADGYICEASIEYGQMLSLDFSAGNTIGFHSSIDDTDIENGDTELFMTWTGLGPHDQSMGYGHMVLSADSVPAPEPVNPGTGNLVHSWTFDDGTANDVVGDAEGVLIGDAAVVDGQLVLDGDGDWMDMPGDVIAINTFEGLTIEIMFTSVAGGNTGFHMVTAFGEEGTGDNPGYGYKYVCITPARGDNVSRAMIQTVSMDNDPWSEETGVSDVIEHDDGLPHHMVCTVDDTELAFYIDGVLIGTAALDPPGNSIAGLGTDVARIGKGVYGVDPLWAGSVDYLNLFNRALSEQEVRYLAGERATPVDPGTDGLLASYALDGDANDSSGNGIDGIIHNADTGGWGDGGSVWVDDPDLGTVISFSGTADGAHVRAGEIPQMTLENDFTWSFWAKQIGDNTADNDIILGNRMDENAVDFVPRQFIKFTPTKFEWHMNGNGDDNLEYEDIPNDIWLHHTVVKIADQLTYYRDGVEHSSGVITQALDVPQPLFFGGDNEGSAGENWNGMMADVAIYDRALSVGEVLYLAGYRPAPSPVGHWTLDEGSGTTIADSSGNGNDGTLVDNPVWDIAWITGPSGGAIEFYGVGTANGNGDYFDCGSDSSLNMTGPISIALWIRPDADDPEGQATTTAPMSKTDGSDWSWQVRYGWNSPQPYMAFTFNSSPRAWAYVGQNLVQGEWCHIACSHDGATLKCYLDGAETDSTPMGQFGGVGTPVLIGTDGWGCDWIGAIDDARIYNAGLSEAEILDVMAGM